MSADITRLKANGIEFYTTTKTLAGTPTSTGVIPFITVRAEDPHGEYATVYLTIDVNDYRPDHRRITYPKYPDVNVTVGTLFTFQLSDMIFWD